jgi:hypothetical protein
LFDAYHCFKCGRRRVGYILTRALCCSVLLVRSNWHKIKLFIYFHLLLESYNIKTKFHDHFIFKCFIMRIFVQICELFHIHVTFHNLYVCVIWSSCKRIWVVHCLVILHSTSFFCIAWYSTLHNNFVFKDKNIHFLHVMIERWLYEKTDTKWFQFGMAF